MDTCKKTRLCLARLDTLDLKSDVTVRPNTLGCRGPVDSAYRIL